jgi:tetratricopeptide (TPR) repeat protein
MSESLRDVIKGLAWVQDRARNADATLKRPAIPYLLGALNAVPSAEEKSHLLMLLAIEYGALGQTEQQIYALNSAAELNPTDPCPWTDLSDAHRLNGDLAQSILDAQRAVKLAESAGRYHRNALQTLARSLRASEMYRELETVLDALIALPGTIPDSAIETDFLVGLPDGAVSAAKINSYKNQRR